MLGMQMFVGIEFDENSVEGVVVEFGKMNFEVDDVALFVIVIMLKIALEFKMFVSLIEDEAEDDEGSDEDEDWFPAAPTNVLNEELVDEVLIRLDCEVEFAPDGLFDDDKLLWLLIVRVTLKLGVVGERWWVEEWFNVFPISDVESTWDKTVFIDKLDPEVSGDIIAVEFEETELDSSSGVRVAMGFEAGKPKFVRSEDVTSGKDVDWIPFSDNKGLFWLLLADNDVELELE